MRFPILTGSFCLKSLPIAFAIFLNSAISFSQEGKDIEAVFVLKGNTKLNSGRNIEGVEIELRKDGKTLEKIFSGKNGRYLISMDVSILNSKSEYILYITYPGTIPKSLSVNTFIPKEQYEQNKYPRYEFTLEIVMIETNVKDIVIEKPSGKIRWENDGFKFDQVYAKIASAEAERMKDENYLRELAEKRKKEEEEAARKKAEEEARLKAEQDAKTKAEEEARRLADAKSKAEADRILKENMEAMKLEIRKRRIQDSLDSLNRLSASKANIEIKKMSRPVSPDDVDPNAFDGTSAYAINIAKRALKAQQERLNREKAKNLSAKYETNNTLTSLLNVVDDYDKNAKFKAKSQTP